MARRRHLSRIAVMQTLFELEKRASDPPTALTRNLDELSEGDQAFAGTLLSGVLDHMDELKEALERSAPGWSLDRMDPISRCTLLIGSYELLHTNDVPPAVVMNEAIDIAKEYGSEESGKFVNGVLNAIAHRGDK